MCLLFIKYRFDSNTFSQAKADFSKENTSIMKHAGIQVHE